MPGAARLCLKHRVTVFRLTFRDVTNLQVLPDFAFAFEGSGEDGCGFYYTCERTRQLSERFGDLLHKIRDLEARPVSHKRQINYMPI